MKVFCKICKRVLAYLGPNEKLVGPEYCIDCMPQEKDNLKPLLNAIKSRDE